MVNEKKEETPVKDTKVEDKSKDKNGKKEEEEELVTDLI